jgi:hypothetical protein
MSKAISVVNTGLQEVTPITVKAGKKEVVSSEVLTSWLEESASGSAALTSVVPSQVHRKYRFRNLTASPNPMSLKDCAQATTVFGGGGLFSSGVVYIIAYAIEPDLISNLIFNLGVVGSTTLLGAVGWIPFFVPSLKKQAAVWHQLKEVQSRGTKAWLAARYGIEVSHSTLNKLAEFILLGRTSVMFADVSKQLWTLRTSPGSAGFLVQPRTVVLEKVTTPTQLSQAPIMVSVGAKDLPVEVQSVVDQVDARLSQLHQFALTTEEAHVVARSVKDAQEAVMTFEQLRILGAEASGVNQLVAVMEILLSELEGIVNKKAAAVSERLVAQQAIMNARQSEARV